MATSLPVHHAGVIAYAAGGLALFALAAPAPNFATLIVIVLIALVLLQHADSVAGILSGLSQAVTGAGPSK